MATYQKVTESTSTIDEHVGTGMAGDLDGIAREGARRLLVSALEAEVTEFLGRQRYERTEASPGYRNGYGKARRVTLGIGTVEIRAPERNEQHGDLHVFSFSRR